MIAVTCGSGAVRVELVRSGVLYGRMSGVITIGTLSAMSAERQRQMPGMPAAAVIDYRHAVVAFSARQLSNWMRDQGAGFRCVPSALVAHEEYVDLFLQHAADMAVSAVNRQVFLDPLQALDWATAHGVRRQWTSSLGLQRAR